VLANIGVEILVRGNNKLLKFSLSHLALLVLEEFVCGCDFSIEGAREKNLVYHIHKN